MPTHPAKPKPWANKSKEKFMNFSKTLDTFNNNRGDIDAIFTEELECTGEVDSDCQAENVSVEDCGDELVIDAYVIVEPEIPGSEDNPFPSREAKWEDVRVIINKLSGDGQVQVDF
jgi:hypothetical protein